MSDKYSAFSLEAAHDRDPYVIRIGGELDRSGCLALEIALIEAEQSPARWILLDLEDLTFTDSQGLTVLVKAANSSARNGRRLRITRGQGQVARRIRMSGLERTLPMINAPPRKVRKAAGRQQTIPNSVIRTFAEERGASGDARLN